MTGDLALAFRLARREMRGGLRGFRVFLACLALGVAAIAAVGSVTDGVLAALEAKGRSILSGDVELRLTHRPAAPEELAYLKENSRAQSEVLRLRAMARAPRTDARTLVELKAVDDVYPLYGGFLTENGTPLDAALRAEGGQWGALIDPGLADRLRISAGDELKIGESVFMVRDLIADEPDRGSEGFQLGPSVVVSSAAMPETGLVQLGSLIRYHYRLALDGAVDLESWTEALSERFPDAGWRIRDRENASPGIREFIKDMGTFLTLVGLAALVVGGVGVGNAVKGYLDGKRATIATFKTLGAGSDLVFSIYVLQIAALALAGILIGLAIGAAAPIVLSQALSARLPVTPGVELYPAALAMAATFGALTTLIFTLWPLAQAKNVPAAHLFRSMVETERHKPARGYLWVIAAAFAALAGLAVLFAEEKLLAAGFIAATVVVVLLLRGLAHLIERTAQRAPRISHPGARLAIANLHRPGAATAAVVLSLGLGLTLFAGLAGIEANMARQVSEAIPDQAPAFFFVDIQKAEIDAFRDTVNGVENVGALKTVPSLRGPITMVDGVPSHEVEPSDEAWVLRGDRGLTFAERIPDGNIITAGDWWPADYDGPPLISLGDEVAAGLGIGVGDTLTMNVLGREITAEIASLRSIDWGTYGFNFVIIFAPGALEGAPYTYMATVEADGAAEAAVFRAVTDRFPGVSVIRMKEVLTSVNDILAQIGGAVRVTAVVAIIAGIFVLAGAMAAGHQARVYDSVILKVLGATRGNVLGAYLSEYALLGIVTGVLALVLGTLAAYFVVTQLFEQDFFVPWGPMALTIAVALVLTIGFGLIATFRALGAKVNRVLAAT